MASFKDKLLALRFLAERFNCTPFGTHFKGLGEVLKVHSLLALCGACVCAFSLTLFADRGLRLLVRLVSTQREKERG